MQKIKVFKNFQSIEIEMNRWIEQVNPRIISMTSSMTQHGYTNKFAVVVLYEDKEEFNV